MRVVSPRRYDHRAGTDVQMRMLQEAFGGLGEPTEEDIHRLVDLVIELIHNRIAEETVEQPAVGTPEIPVMHQRKGPSTSHPK